VIDIYCSSLGGLRLSKRPSVSWREKEDDAQLPIATINPEERHQRVAGFGASILQAGAMNMNSLDHDKQDELLDLMFSSNGARLSLMKVPIPCNDFCGNKTKWWTYDDVSDDYNLTHFSIERDLNENGTLTFVKKARAHGFDGFLQSYMDYPPDWILSTKTPLPGSYRVSFISLCSTHSCARQTNRRYRECISIRCPRKLLRKIRHVISRTQRNN